jgi:hypothetical protein
MLAKDYLRALICERGKAKYICTKKKYIAKKLTANTSVPLEANNAAFC